MNKLFRAANVMNFAHSLDLQLFNDEFLETPVDTVSDAIETTEPTEVTENIENIETTEDVTSEVENEVQESKQEDVTQEPAQEITQTQAFARRLKEETERARQEAIQQARDAFIAEQGYEWNGKPITTETEYKQALYEQQLVDAGQNPETIKQLVDEHPDVVMARNERQKAQQMQKLVDEWTDLTKEHSDIKDFSDVPNEVYEYSKATGKPLLDAYNRYFVKNQKEQIEKVKLETEQETIKKIQKNATTSPGSASSDGVIHKTKSVMDMTPEEFEAYKEEVRRQRKDDY